MGVGAPAGRAPRVAVVTGSDSGIGKATAVALAEAGFDVGVTWHEDEEGARGTVAEVEERGRRAELRRLRLEDLPGGADAVDELAEALGGLDVLVNNAGTGQSVPFLDLDLGDWRHVLEVDLTGAFVCAQRAARRMVDAGRGGRIINVTSVHEHVPLRGSAAYCAAKGGLGLLTKVMALELAEHAILVNTVAPGEVSTPMTASTTPTREARTAPASPSAARATPRRSPMRWCGWRARSRPTSRAPRSWSTAASCSWRRWPTAPEGR